MSACKARAPRRTFWRSEDGAVAVEFSFVSVVFLTMLIGALEFGHAFWQWNQATKALQLGARLAAVSRPVSSDLATMTGVSGTVEAGDPMPYFKRVCSGSSQSCSGGMYGTRRRCAPSSSAAAMPRCPTTVQNHPAMCQLFPRVRPENVIVEYEQTGLGFAGRPGGPLPSIKVRLAGLSFNYAVLGTMLGLPNVPMSGLVASVTAEDLKGG